MYQFILKMEQILGSQGRTSCVIFPEFLPACENPFIPSVHSWDKVNFTVQRLNCPHPFLTTSTQKIFGQILIFVNLYQHAKNEGISSTFSGNIADSKTLQSDLLKTFGLNLKDKIFANIGFAQNSVKWNDPIPKKDPDRQQHVGTHRYHSVGSFWLPPGV